jgi:PHD/YefM family antitoxin component YafN of YafNO toxin-antitoxin module
VVTYAKDEIITATQLVRNFSTAFRALCDGEKEKIVIVKNNRLEAVMLPIEKYEKMSEAVALLEKIYEKTKIKPTK